MTRLVWVNDQQIFNNKFNKLRDSVNFDWQWWHFMAFREPNRYLSFLPRFNSDDLCPWSNHLGYSNYFDLTSAVTSKTLDEILSIRSNEVLELMAARDLPLMLHWSGGIDSTLVLVSLLENFSSADLSNVFIALNISSINENPEFFLKHILGKFKLVDSSQWTPDIDTLKSFIHLTGQYADQLFPAGFSQEQVNSGQPIIPLSKLKNDPIERIIADAIKDGVKLENLGDLHWWLNFNYHWTEIDLKDILEFVNYCDAERYSVYVKNHIHWFKTNDFQIWSLNNNDRSYKMNTKLYKTEFKQHIYHYDKNETYLINKTKQGSSRTKSVKTPTILGLLDTGETITLDHPAAEQLLFDFLKK